MYENKTFKSFPTILFNSNMILQLSHIETSNISLECFDYLASITARGEHISQYDSTSDAEQNIKQIEFI